MTDLALLKKTEESINKALEDARRRRNEEDRKFIVSAIGQDLVKILTPLLQQIAQNSRTNLEDMKEVIRGIKVEAPQVNVAAPKVDVQTPKAVVDVNFPPVKMPPIKVPTPKVQVTVKPADVHIPKEMEIKDMSKLLKAIEGMVNQKVELATGGINPDKPLNVVLTDPKGQEYRALTSMVVGGGGKVVTTRPLIDVPQGFEQLTIAATAIGLASIPDKATKAVMTVEDSTMRYRTDGTDPTATVGLRVFVGGTIVLNSRQQIVAFRSIRTGASSSEVNCEYYEVI